MIKYYDLYDNDCNINYPTFFKRKEIKKSRKIVFHFRAYVLLSQCSIRLTASILFSLSSFLISYFELFLPLVTISSTDITAYMVLLLTSRFNIFIYSIRLLSNVNRTQFIDTLIMNYIVLTLLFFIMKICPSNDNETFFELPT